MDGIQFFKRSINPPSIEEGLELVPLSVTDPNYDRDQFLQDLFREQFVKWSKRTSWHIEERDRKIASLIIIHSISFHFRDPQEFLRDLLDVERPIHTSHMTRFSELLRKTWVVWQNNSWEVQAEKTLLYTEILSARVDERIREEFLLTSPTYERDMRIQNLFFCLFDVWKAKPLLQVSHQERMSTVQILVKFCPRVSVLNRDLLGAIESETDLSLETILKVSYFLEEIWNQWKKDPSKDQWNALLFIDGQNEEAGCVSS